MREITVKLYQYDELDDAAKGRALDWAGDDGGMRSEYEWEYVQEDAKNIGLSIRELSDRSPNKGAFIDTALDCARRIIKEHGKTCETRKTAERYYDALEAADEDNIEETEGEFLHDLLEDYRVMLDKAIEYAYSREALEEDVRANEYEFTEEGKRA